MIKVTFRLLPFVFLVLLSFIINSKGNSQPRALKKKIKREKFEEAIAIANEEIKRYPVNKNGSDLHQQTVLERALPYYIALGQVYAAMGQYERAEQAYLDAKEVSEERIRLTSGTNKIRDIDLDLLDGLAEIQLESGNYQGAGKLLEYVINLRHDKYKKKSVKRYRSHLYYGRYLMTQGNYDEAYDFLEHHVLVVRDKIYNAYGLYDFDRLAMAYEWLTRLELERGNIKEAKHFARKNIKYQNHRWEHRIKGKNNLGRIEALNLAAKCRILRGDFSKAWHYSDKGLALYNKVLKEPTIHKVPILMVRAELFWRMNKVAEAYNYFNEANDIQLKFINDNLSRLTEYEQANFMQEAKENFELYFEFAKSMLAINSSLSIPILADAYNLQINTKARLLEETHNRISTLSEQSTYLVNEDYQRWRDLRNEYARLIARADGLPESEQKIETTQNQIAQVEKTMSLTIIGFNPTEPLVDWREIALNLNENEIAIEVIRIKNTDKPKSTDNKSNSSYLFLGITREAESPAFTIIENGDSIENRMFNYYLNTKKSKIEDNYSYDMYFKPLLGLIGDKKVVHISADGIYNFINLSILSKGTDYVLDHYTIYNHTNTKFINQDKDTTYQFASATLFGRPQYGDDSLPPIQAIDKSEKNAFGRAIMSLDTKVPDLPGTEQEINVIQDLLKDQLDVTVKLHEDASEEALKSIASSDILHIATHGFFISKSSGDPMMSSGLLLSGVNSLKDNNAEDGLFTAYEATLLDLSNTKLVVLSACETGLGEIKNGEGVYGLQRSFEIAGAKSILMSLWKIDDQATVILMEAFYKELISTGSPILALKRAQDQIKKDPTYNHPYYWGAFKLIEN